MRAEALSSSSLSPLYDSIIHSERFFNEQCTDLPAPPLSLGIWSRNRVYVSLGNINILINSFTFLCINTISMCTLFDQISITSLFTIFILLLLSLTHTSDVIILLFVTLILSLHFLIFNVMLFLYEVNQTVIRTIR